MRTNFLKLTSAGLLLAGVSAYGVPITVDTVLADVAGQTASVDMTLSGSTLTIVLRNTTGAGGPSGADGLLTGLAFNLPGTLAIVTSGSGAAVASGSTIVGGSLNGSGGGTSLQGEWGYANGAGSGHFNGLAVDAQVSAMEADTDTAFGASIDPPHNTMDGPEYGLMRTGGDAGGNTAINNAIVITLQLSGSFGGNLLAAIESGTVAVTFGSPTGTTVPDGGATVMLLGAGLAALGASRRFLKI